MTQDQKIAIHHLFNALINDALTVQTWEDDDYGVYLWGTHDVDSEAAQAALADYAGRTEHEPEALSDPLRGGDALYAHPIVLELDEGWGANLVSREYRDGWVPFVRGVMP